MASLFLYLFIHSLINSSIYWQLRHCAIYTNDFKISIKDKELQYLYCRLMLRHGEEGSRRVSQVGIPHIHQVIVSSTGQLSTIVRPLETTHFLSMRCQCTDMMLGSTHIMMVNYTTSGTTIQTEKNPTKYIFQLILNEREWLMTEENINDLRLLVVEVDK